MRTHLIPLQIDTFDNNCERSYEITVKIRKQSLDMPLGPLLPLVISHEGDTDCRDCTWVDFIYSFIHSF